MANSNPENQFTSENQPANKGRRKNKFKSLKDKYELSSCDVNAIIEYQMSLTKAELEEKVIENNKKTVLEQAFAKAILESMKKGDLSQIEKLLDRKIGKVANNVDITTKGKELPVNININPVKSDKE